ncbi:hypothetical protein J5N97_012608 [Dioscorea zingiberensis]|uniref:Uncharacterized protein n=1 Tax=Dioscorea zingiberensis TaxID=325984 RepID=A0A9D5HHY4_9LILI|nr:hypothetical protein J5N97_012608 [Dioscorea zingiberensis]
MHALQKSEILLCSSSRHTTLFEAYATWAYDDFIVDEMDYLITKDQAVLHDLFMLSTPPYSRCILIGIANAIDLADRFLPRLEPLNCKPTVVTFYAYSKAQILKIIQQRLSVLGQYVFFVEEGACVGEEVVLEEDEVVVAAVGKAKELVLGRRKQ